MAIAGPLTLSPSTPSVRAVWSNSKVTSRGIHSWQKTEVLRCIDDVIVAVKALTDRIMTRPKRTSLLLWVAAAVAAAVVAAAPGGNASPDDMLVQNFSNKSLQVIPRSDNSSTVIKLVIGANRITLNGTDRLALASYPGLTELHLDSNLVTAIPAKYFSVVPHLRVLSLSRNTISSLDPECFSGLDVLTELDLSHNLLTGLHTQLSRQLSTLQVLNLQGNPWNCSCPLLSSEAIHAMSASTGEPEVTCASQEGQSGKDLMWATAVCYTPTPPTSTKDQQKAAPKVHVQQSSGLEKTSTSQNHMGKDGPDQTPVLGNSWKFTACVVALTLCTSMLIVCGIRGPSWYKRFHDYRHQKLRQEEEEEDTVSTVFTQIGDLNQWTFASEQERSGIEEEEEEDGYFEDSYIKGEE
ncbi:leucine-rich repeat-containing protein 19-like [Brachionichthys hirsutus]|uniref:leucine-rich repeat-containing protein 19-like n=1 Tax=Brachionichthys hirsutus TaxID=412623 RepID=UPI003604DECE